MVYDINAYPSRYVVCNGRDEGPLELIQGFSTAVKFVDVH